MQGQRENLELQMIPVTVMQTTGEIENDITDDWL